MVMTTKCISDMGPKLTLIAPGPFQKISTCFEDFISSVLSKDQRRGFSSVPV